MTLFGRSALKSALRRSCCWILAIALVVQALPTLAFADAMAAPSSVSGATQINYPPLLIGPGDMVGVTVYGETGLPDRYLVDSTGTIVFPLVGAIVLGGLTQVEASQALTAALSKYLKEPQVTVLVVDSAQYTVSVMGNVVKPGIYLIRGLPTLLGALAQAGGPLPHSDLNDTVLVRDNKSIKMPLGIYFDSSHAAQSQPLIYPGDVILVPESPWPTLAEWGIIASILSSAAILTEAIRAH
jgi:polysaccharide biosynthesis/export protein